MKMNDSISTKSIMIFLEMEQTRLTIAMNRHHPLTSSAELDRLQVIAALESKLNSINARRQKKYDEEKEKWRTYKRRRFWQPWIVDIIFRTDEELEDMLKWGSWRYISTDFFNDCATLLVLANVATTETISITAQDFAMFGHEFDVTEDKEAKIKALLNPKR